MLPKFKRTDPHVSPPTLWRPRQRRFSRPRLVLPGLAPFIITRPKVVAGNQTFNSPGTFSFTIPYCDTLDIYTDGGCGGGGGAAAFNGSVWVVGGTGGNGGYSQAYLAGQFNVIGYGGAGGNGCPLPWGDTSWYWFYSQPRTGNANHKGADGTASGGNIENTTGGYGGATGAQDNGGLSRMGQYDDGSGNVVDTDWCGGNGGRGGRAHLKITASGLQGQSVSVVVGAGGGAGSQTAGWPGYDTIRWPGAGWGGVVYFFWS